MGPGCLKNCGEWDNDSTNYNVGDFVTYQGKTYAAKFWTADDPDVNGWIEGNLKYCTDVDALSFEVDKF